MSPPALVALFPGQGAIKPGAGRPWRDHPAWSEVARVEAVADRPIGWLLLDAPAEALAATDAAQLATLALSLVAWRSMERDLQASLVGAAGHSLGQITALIATGVVPYEEGLAFAVARAEATAAANDDVPGALVALVGATPAQAEAACAAAPGRCWVANDNAPGQLVLGGTSDGVVAAASMARELGVTRAIPLAVGGAFHTPLMITAVDALRPAAASLTVRPGSVPVVDNTLARPQHDVGVWPDLLLRHLVEPVRWRDVQTVLVEEQHATTAMELAPAGILTGLARRTVPGLVFVRCAPSAAERLAG